MFRIVPLSIIRSFSLYTQQWYMSYRFAMLHWKTPDDGQRNCPKHVEFHSKNKFEKLVHLVGFITRTSILIRSLQSPLSVQRIQIGPIIIRYFVRSEIILEVIKYGHRTFCVQNVSETLRQNWVANFAHQNGGGGWGGEKIPIDICPRKHFPRYSPKLSPDPSTFDSYLWGQCKAQVYLTPVKKEVTLHQSLSTIFNCPGTPESLRQSVIRRVHACIDLCGGRLTICCELWLAKLW